jgi:hypothetical protein
MKAAIIGRCADAQPSVPATTGLDTAKLPMLPNLT